MTKPDDGVWHNLESDSQRHLADRSYPRRPKMLKCSIKTDAGSIDAVSDLDAPTFAQIAIVDAEGGAGIVLDAPQALRLGAALLVWANRTLSTTRQISEMRHAS